MNNNNTIFALEFNKNIQKDFTKKFNYKIFLTNKHDTYKLRSSVYIYKYNINTPKCQKLGNFLRNNNNAFWIFYMPRIDSGENIKTNEIYSLFLKNLQNDIGTGNDDDVYTVLANLYESIPPNYFMEDNTLNFTFYHLLASNNNNNNNLNIYPTYSRICNKVSQQVLDCKQLKLLFLSFLLEEKDKYKDDDDDYNNLLSFMTQFANMIVEKKCYNNIIDSSNNFYSCKRNKCIKKTNYNEEIKNVIINLIERCKIDDDPIFLYSNLGKLFYEKISKPFMEKNTLLIELLNIMLFKNLQPSSLLPDKDNNT